MIKLVYYKPFLFLQAIHEAARGGYLDILRFLINNGADIGAVTNTGGTPLWWARRFLEADDPLIGYLASIGAPEGSGPEAD